jgi:hypothetical protein
VTDLYYMAEQTACPKCGNREGNFILEYLDNYGPGPNPHSHRCCGACFIHYVIEIPSNLRRFPTEPGTKEKA